MAENLNSINSIEEKEYKWSLLERIRNSTKNVVASLVAAGSMSIWWVPVGPAAAIWTTAFTVTACSSDEPDNPNDTTAPTINVSQHDIDITWWKQIRINWNQLYIWDVLVASWTDNVTKNCKVELSLNWKPISSWTTINEWWYLTIKVTDDAGNTRTIDVNLIINNQLISWLENLRNLEMQVDQEVNLLNWITFLNWASLVKVEIEMNWQTTQITDPNHFVPFDWWACAILITVQWKDGKLVTERVDKEIKRLEYHSMEINNIRPVEILPIIWQVESWDKNVYEHIEHLKLAEATRIRDMMRKYGAGSHSSAEYQQLMSRLNTGMRWEVPLWYNNYEIIWWNLDVQPTDHAHTERHTLNTLIKHANLKLVGEDINNSRQSNLKNYINNHPNSINIFWCSSYNDAYNKSDYQRWILEEDIIDLLNSQNIIIFAAGTNIKKPWWVLKNKIYNWDYEADDHWVYSLASMSNSKKNTKPNSHLIVTIATDADGDIDQTNETSESSKYPVWFANNMLFSWRAFPKHYYSWEIAWEWIANHWKYATSHTNYVNVAMADLCFQMFAEVQDVNQLLNMIRSTSLTDYIRFNWETQELQLINPAWFFKKYCMPTNLPTQINSWETITLNKWYYKWVIFDIPWAEVMINWQWVAYNESNKSLIKSQNPMNLQWRLNWNLCSKMWYKWKTINWKIITVDDDWNGLDINDNINVKVQ